MKTLSLALLLLIALLIPSAAIAQEDVSATKTYCTSAAGYANVEAMKADLLAAVKRQLVNELFGESITASTTVEQMIVTSDQIRASSQGFVRTSGDPIYANGSDFAQICVTLTGYVTAEDLARFQPVALGNRLCKSDPALSATQLRDSVRTEAIAQALLNYDPRLSVFEQSQLLQLMRRIVFDGSGFLPDSDIFCAVVAGDVIPIEVLALVETTGVVAEVTPVPTPAPTATALTAAPPTATLNPAQTPNGTATAAFATAQAYLSRTPSPTPSVTPTPSLTPTPDATATAVFALSQVISNGEQAGLVDITVVGDGNAIARNPIDGATYVFVPAGEFAMGTRSGEGRFDEYPQHTVTLDAFWIMQTEVTNAMYSACVQAGACSAPSDDEWEISSNAQRPVANVDWIQAFEYAMWAGGNLPTEAQWEKACRGTDAFTYPWGDRPPNPGLAHFDVRIGQTKPVGSIPVGASPFGALDMAGNVWEWTADWYGGTYYGASPAENPVGPSSGQGRVLRGGSFSNNASYVRCAARNWETSSTSGARFGFRVAYSGN